MTGKRDHLEQYEDSLFALMMDCVAEEEGRRAMELNGALGEDPEAAVPEAVRKRGEQTIRKAFSSQKRSKAGRGLWKGVRVAAVVALLLAATLTVPLATSPALRVNLANTILDIYQDHTEFSFQEKIPQDVELDIAAGWLPEGFEMTEDDSIPSSAWKTYQNAEGATIHINKSLPIKTYVDTQNAQMERIKIQGNTGTLIAKNEEARVIWLDRKKGVVYLVDTYRLSVDTLLKIAENVS